MSSGDELHRGTVTFLFTDIEGSTRLLRRLGDQYAEVLETHQAILRDVFTKHGGREMDTQGDAFFVAFPRARDAIGAAIDAQRMLAKQVWPEGTELRVRMGIHTGEPTIGGARYIGMGIHRAARISAVGHGGQVLVSQTTRELVRDDPMAGVSFVDLGEHELRDLEAPERIHQVVAPGLGELFPPLTTRGSAPGTPPMRSRRVRLASLGVAAAAVATAVGVLLATGGGTKHAFAAVAANAVGVIDLKSGKIGGVIPVGNGPSSVAAARDAVWVANSDDDTVSRIDPTTQHVSQTITVGGDPTGVAAEGDSVWVTNGDDGTVSWINASANRVVGTPIRVGNGPEGVAYGDGDVWVANSVDGTISQIDPSTGRVSRTIPALLGADAIAFGFGRLWVASPSKDVVAAVDPRSGDVVARIGVGVEPSALTVAGGAVWVANESDGTVMKIDPSALAVTDTIQVGSSPGALAAGKGTLWVGDAGSGTLSEIALPDDRWVKTVTLANPPQGLAVASQGLYVAVGTTGLARRGGTLRVVAAMGIDSIDPALAYTDDTWSVLSMTGDGLVAFRRTGGIQGVQLVPDLAESLPTPTDGGTTYVFRVRPGIRYSNGERLSPDDFRRAIERLFEVEPASGGAHYYADIIGAAGCKPGRRCDLSRGIVTDPVAGTVTFRLASPDPDFLSVLALTFAAAVPAGTPSHRVGFDDPVPATGPYRIASATKSTVRLARNPFFHQWSAQAQPDGFPDTIVFSESTQGGLARAVAVERGQADVARALTPPPIPKEQLAALAARYPTRLHESTAPLTSFFFLNTRVPPFDDPNVRIAVNDAFDRAALGEMLGGGFAPTCQIIPPDFPAYRPFCPYGSGSLAALTRARDVVLQSGRSGMKVLVWIDLPSLAVQGRYMVSVLDAIGFRASLHVAAPTAYFPTVDDSRHRVQVGIDAWQSDFPSLAGFLAPLFLCSSFVPGSAAQTVDPSELCDPALDREINRAIATQAVDPPAANALWQQTERTILATAPIVPIYNPRNIDLVSKRVGDYQYNPQWGVLLDQLWVR